MSNRVAPALLMILCVLAISPSFNNFTSVSGGIWDARYVIQTTVTYFNMGAKPWHLSEEDKRISLFMNNTWQTVCLTACSQPISSTKRDEDGNPTVVLQLPTSTLEPGENLTYKATYDVVSKERKIPLLDDRRSETFTEISESLKQKYCREGDGWQITDSTLRETAYAIVGNETNSLSIVRKLIVWIWNHIDYWSSEVPRYPNETLAGGSGDCDDQAILLITFCRIIGIPSFLQIGCVYEYGSIQRDSWNGTVTSFLENVVWHGWAMVYIPPWGWLPIDLTYVRDGKEDPLNAIRAGAVTSRRTIQFMNISEIDYIASARAYRDFIIQNRIHISQRDEMAPAFPRFFGQSIRTWIRWFLIAIGIVTGIVIVVSTSIFAYRKLINSEASEA